MSSAGEMTHPALIEGAEEPEIRLEFLKAVLEKLNDVAADDDLRLHYRNFEAVSREIVDFFFFAALGSRNQSQPADAAQ